MINFFRKIRKQLADDNKPLKYMRYAVGEIVLVVIGILIALQINNWNEEQKTQQRLTDFLTEIQNNLSNDILEANNIIDNYINKDSILRNIKYNKVNYTLDNILEHGQSFLFIYKSENFRLQTKGFDGLVQNIDNIPSKYTDLMDLLNYIYGTNNIDLVTFSQRVQNNVYANKDNLKNKSWSSDFWDVKLNEESFKYFESDSYKNDARHFFNDLRDLIFAVIKFKIVAIDAYKEIQKFNPTNIPIPKHINYTFPNPEILLQIAGGFQIEYTEMSDTDDVEEYAI